MTNFAAGNLLRLTLISGANSMHCVPWCDRQAHAELVEAQPSSRVRHHIRRCISDTRSSTTFSKMKGILQ